MDDDADANAAALTWARRAEAAARDEAEEARNVAAAARRSLVRVDVVGDGEG